MLEFKCILTHSLGIFSLTIHNIFVLAQAIINTSLFIYRVSSTTSSPWNPTPMRAHRQRHKKSGKIKTRESQDRTTRNHLHWNEKEENKDDGKRLKNALTLRELPSENADIFVLITEPGCPSRLYLIIHLHSFPFWDKTPNTLNQWWNTTEHVCCKVISLI